MDKKRVTQELIITGQKATEIEKIDNLAEFFAVINTHQRKLYQTQCKEQGDLFILLKSNLTEKDTNSTKSPNEVVNSDSE